MFYFFSPKKKMFYYKVKAVLKLDFDFLSPFCHHRACIDNTSGFALAFLPVKRLHKFRFPFPDNGL